MEINVSNLTSDPAASELLEYLRNNETELDLEVAQVYYDFPLYRDEEIGTIAASILLLSAKHGIMAIQASNVTAREDIAAQLVQADTELGRVFSALYSRLIRRRPLQRSRTELKFPFTALILAPYIGSVPSVLETEFDVITQCEHLGPHFVQSAIAEMPPEVFNELVAVVEGTKGIIRPKPRDVADTPEKSKGKMANAVEAAIMSFDRQQKRSSIIASFDGPQRIRGLAGSGKTVVLCLKAALTHLRYPDANIVYTFYTKSLYQHIRRLITRFYREYDDQDPNWNKLQIIHGWGGQTAEGVYFNACVEHGVSPLTFSQARGKSRSAPFDYACRQLIASAKLKPMYDYVLVDEGQDFPASFINLCAELARDRRVVWAYDDLQTIFQTHAPTPGEVFGVKPDGSPQIELNLDTVLHKCYRNPREILVCAHAVGFGIYGQIVQMLENREHWEDIGYVVREGSFVEGSEMVIERPEENSLLTISQAYVPDELVQVKVYDDFDQEVESVAHLIKDDLGDGLRPDDILVICVDDRHANTYLRKLSQQLADMGVQSNNLHSDSFGIRDFRRKNQVTLSTVHKAKGNEAFMVYVVGVDALYSSRASVRERNMLFTAMTRAKGWVRVSGIGEWAQACKQEVDAALSNFPYLKFDYPSEEQLKIMKRDLTNKGQRKLKVERMLERAMQEMTPEEIARFVSQRSLEKG